MKYNSREKALIQVSLQAMVDKRKEWMKKPELWSTREFDELKDEIKEYEELIDKIKG